MGIQNVLDHDGIGLALAGIAIVFFALTLVSLFIAGLPKVLPLVSAILPVVEHPHGGSPSGGSARPAGRPGGRADEEIVAAIGFALHHRKPKT